MIDRPPINIESLGARQVTDSLRPDVVNEIAGDRADSSIGDVSDFNLEALARHYNEQLGNLALSDVDTPTTE